MIHVLVTDPEQRAALTAVRSLGRAGFVVSTIGEQRGIAGASKYVARHFSLPVNTYQNSEQFLAQVQLAVSSTGAQVVIPVTDRASRTLIEQDARLGARVAGPTRSAYLAASDKAQLLERAAHLGIRVPFQHTLASASDGFLGLGDIPHNSPVVVKPARSVVEVDGKLVGTSVRYATMGESLAAAIARYPAAAYPLMIQERIVGDGVGLFLLRQGGDTKLAFAHRRIREKPPAGGVSTCRESIAPPPDLVTKCERLLDELGYEGACMIEFKRDHATQKPVLMEINARLWGSVQLAVDAGIDFPLAMVQMALGQPVTVGTVARVGVRSVWELGELDHALALARRSAQELHLPEGQQSGFAAALKALMDRRLSDKLEVLRLSDPKPFFAELIRWFGGR